MDRREAEKLETKCIWDANSNRWVCKFCGRHPNIFYIVTGHDHTDDSIWTCECRKEQTK